MCALLRASSLLKNLRIILPQLNSRARARESSRKIIQKFAPPKRGPDWSVFCTKGAKNGPMRAKRSIGTGAALAPRGRPTLTHPTRPGVHMRDARGPGFSS